MSGHGEKVQSSGWNLDVEQPDCVVPVWRLSEEEEMSLLILHYGKDHKPLQTVTDVLILCHLIMVFFLDRTRVQLPSKVWSFFFNSPWWCVTDLTASFMHLIHGVGNWKLSRIGCVWRCVRRPFQLNSEAVSPRCTVKRVKQISNMDIDIVATQILRYLSWILRWRFKIALSWVAYFCWAAASARQLKGTTLSLCSHLLVWNMKRPVCLFKEQSQWSRSDSSAQMTEVSFCACSSTMAMRWLQISDGAFWKLCGTGSEVLQGFAGVYPYKLIYIYTYKYKCIYRTGIAV